MSQLLDYRPGSERIGDAYRASSAPWLASFGILCNWLSTMFGLLFFPFAITFFVLIAVQRRWRLLALCVALSPMFLGAAAGAVGYCLGRATIDGMGLPGTGYYNLDPELRCEHATGGCLANGGEVLTQLPNNIVVVGLTRLFGPQPGAFIGPYPSEVQAKAALVSAAPIPFELLMKDQVDLTQPPLKLDTGVGSGLLQRTQLALIRGMLPDKQAREWLDEYGPVRGVLYQGGCLILRIPEPDPSSAMIVLLDTKTGRPFAYYGEGQFHQRFPPVTWRR